MRPVFAFFAVLFLLIVCIYGCEPSYYKCPQCHAGYRQYWYQSGLPGQIKHRCGSCGTKLYGCTKEESGWYDRREPTINGY
jgi:predicted Zn finger-like uncharacterized protein